MHFTHTFLTRENVLEWGFYLLLTVAVLLLVVGCLLLQNTISSPFTSMHVTAVSCKMKISVLLQGLGIVGLTTLVYRKF